MKLLKKVILFIVCAGFIAGCNSIPSNIQESTTDVHHIGGNPVIQEGSADPSVRVFNDRVYIYSSHDFSKDNAFWIMKDWKVLLILGNGACLVAELNEDMISFKSDIQQVIIEDHKGYTEGPFVWKRNGIYYMLYSQGGGRAFDRLDYATSDHIKGPYQYRGSIVAHGKKGNIHGSVFEFKDQWYVAYHDMFPTDKYRMTCFDRIHYRQDGSIVGAQASRTGVGWYNASEKIEAEDYFDKSEDAIYVELDSGLYMHHLRNGQWLRFTNLQLPFDFTNHFQLHVSGIGETGRIELFLDELDGINIGEIEIPGDPQSTWGVLESEITSFSGIHDLYLRFSGSSSSQMNLDWFLIY